jgi:endonuclease/exonuclease/phosphatase family metal-dependent hydrolase
MLLKHLLTCSDSLRDNRALWITISGTPIGRVGIANIYTSNCSRERSKLWDNLSNTLDSSYTWILGGDWNMSEKLDDKSTGCSRSLSQIEAASWTMLKMSLDLEDFFTAGRHLKYSWDNCRVGARVLARLDRFYVSGGNLNKSLVNSYRIRGDSCLSDHLPVSLSLNLQKRQSKVTCFKMNSSLLSVPEVKSEITRLWNDHPPDTHFLVKFRHVIRYYRRYC